MYKDLKYNIRGGEFSSGDAELASPGDVIKRLELKKYKWGQNLIKIFK